MKRHAWSAKVGLLAAACCVAAEAAPVDPNPNSLLKDKRVLVVRASNWTGSDPSHRDAIRNALAKLDLIKADVGMPRFDVMDNVENMSLSAMNEYDIIVFNYVFNSQLAVGKPFEASFKAWLAQGNRGWIGYHSSGANEENEWNWYRDSVTSMRYHVHSTAAQQGRIHKTADPAIKAHPILEGMDESFTGTDEWYDFDLPPRAPAAPTWDDCKVIYYLDETSLSVKPARPMDPHPMAWFREDHRRNRFFFANFIHSGEGADSDFFHSMLLRALEFAAGYRDPAVSMDRAGIRGSGGRALVALNRSILVHLPGAYTISVYSMKGERLFTATGRGAGTHRPAVFAEPGLYTVKLDSGEEKAIQRILIH